MIFRRLESYDREKCLASARKAEERGRVRKAIAMYTKVLEVSPDDLQVHTKLAPLLARKRKFNEAWESFKAAAAGYRMAGFSQKAIGVYANALRFMPRNPEVWEAMADVYLKEGKRADAVQTLYKGHAYFKRKPYRDVAVRFLRKAFTIEPWNFDVTIELARFLKKIDRVEAFGLLEGLSGRTEGRMLRKVRSEMFFIQPGFSIAWKWLKSA